jgi:hypothetical protein
MKLTYQDFTTNPCFRNGDLFILMGVLTTGPPLAAGTS